MNAEAIDPYLSGQKLYGDDLDPDQLAAWFASEEEGYADLGAKASEKYRYEYHELNRQHLFRFLPDRPLNEALGIGSAYGEEFMPIADRLKAITILEPSSAFSGATQIHGTPCAYVKPDRSGRLPFESGRFDLATCFGVMHHIPNVSFVMGEIHRCLAKGGMFLIREPIVSMGDWRQPRHGLTANERGIPENIFDRIIAETGFKVARKSLYDFRPISIVAAKMGKDTFNSPFAVRMDRLVSNALPWHTKYHRTTFLEKLPPASMAYFLEKA